MTTTDRITDDTPQPEELGPLAERLAAGLRAFDAAMYEVFRPLAEALRQQEPALPEPEDGQAVRLTFADGSGSEVLERCDSLAARSKPRSRWLRTGVLSSETWAEVCSRGTVERLLPESETFPRELASQLVQAMQALLVPIEAGQTPLPSTVWVAREVLAAAEAGPGTVSET